MEMGNESWKRAQVNREVGRSMKTYRVEKVREQVAEARRQRRGARGKPRVRSGVTPTAPGLAGLRGTAQGIAFWWQLALAGWLCVGCALGACAAQDTTDSKVYRFDRPLIETNGASVRVTLPEGGQLHKLGQPALPFRTARLLVPPGFTVAGAEAVPAGEPQRLDGTWHVEYAGEPHHRPGAGKKSFAPGVNHVIYDSDDLYPGAGAELLSVQRMAGYDIALVRVFPVQYRPASGRLIFTPELSVRLRLRPTATNAEPPLRPPNRARAMAQVGAFVDDPEPLRTFGDLAAPPALTGGESIDYLVVTSSNLAAAFEPLLQRKRQDGLQTRLATLEAITNSVPGRDAAERIRNYVRQAYTNWGISYVLLGGATSVVPTRDAFVRTDLPAQDSYVPCDLYYACLDGSWNGNGDRHWGEPGDGEDGGDVDLLAEVYVGRAPVASVEQVRAFVDKTIRCETGPHQHPPGAVLMATYLGDFPTGPCQGADMFQGLLPLFEGWKLTRLDDQPQKRPRWGRAEALAALSGSPRVALYNGHGNADILMRMRTSDLAKLTNEWPFLFCSVGCSAGEFDHGKFWPDSFGEALVNSGPRGAFAAIVNARAGWFDPQYPWKYSGEFQLQVFQELLRRGHTNLGMALQRAKENLIGEVERTGAMTYRWCYYEMTLLGDPHVPFLIPSSSASLSEERAANGVDPNALVKGRDVDSSRHRP
jgi:hypothetical protein